jgi:RNA polymerase sigma factor (sigma-70 family)
VDGFEGFFVEHHAGVVRALTLALGSRAEADEAAQVGFERALRRWRHVRTLDRPATWVYVVALRAARRRWARDDRRPDGPTPGPPADPGEGEPVAVAVREALAALPPRQRAATVLRYYADLPIDDIAAAMGCAPGTVKATLAAARASLRLDLEDVDAG